MENIQKLRERFDKLDVNESNVMLYESLFKLDYETFFPIMEEILDGRIDIEDLRSFFYKNKELTSNTGSAGLPLLTENRTVPENIKDGILAKLFESNRPNEYILPINDTDEKYRLGDKYVAQSGNPLSDVDKEKIITGTPPNFLASTQSDRIVLNPSEINPLLSHDENVKNKQLKLAALLNTNLHGTI